MYTFTIHYSQLAGAVYHCELKIVHSELETCREGHRVCFFCHFWPMYSFTIHRSQLTGAVYHCELKIVHCEL